MQGLVEDVIYVSKGKIPMSGGHAAYQWSCENTGLTSQYDQLVGILSCPQQSFSAKLLPQRTAVASPWRFGPIKVTRIIQKAFLARFHSCCA